MRYDACFRCRRALRAGLHFCTHCGVRLSAPVGADLLALLARR